LQEFGYWLISSLAQYTEAINSKILQGLERNSPMHSLFT
jgi:hypothetical protein